MPLDPAISLCETLKIAYKHGNTYIQIALKAMVQSMLQKVHDKSMLSAEVKSLTTKLQQSEDLCKELQEANEQFNSCSDTVTVLQARKFENAL